MSEFRRRLMMVSSGGGLPYDAEVEYLQSDGTPYIDSGIECTGDLSVEFEGKVTSNINRACLGGIATTSEGYFRHHWSPYDAIRKNFYWLQNDNANIATITHTPSTGTWFHVYIDAIGGNADINGDIITFSPLGEITTGSNYGIFARLGILQRRPCAFKYVKLSRGGVLLRDFIPVRKNGIGFMYDKVSGQLFGNVDGSGAFTFGNDKN